jgi:hypothetical protein
VLGEKFILHIVKRERVAAPVTTLTEKFITKIPHFLHLASGKEQLPLAVRLFLFM